MNITLNDLQLIANTVRGLAMDGVQKANSGHPGMPMGCADMAAVLWAKILKHNPDDPSWKNRDRFILSAGHGSMLLYSMLHLSGYSLSMDELKNFRQFGSLTPGHPEFGHTAGVETTTGPLGQGFANGVGMALAENLLAGEFGNIIDHYIYAIVSDGDLMEGVASEAASIAGHLGLGRLIYLYDSNSISIEGSTDITFGENAEARFKAYGWHVQEVDGHDFTQIENAIIAAQKETSRPSIIIATTCIAKGCSGKEGSADSHGAPLGEKDVAETKKSLGLDPEKYFQVPDKVYEIFKSRKTELLKVYSQWNNDFNKTVSGDLKLKWNRFFSDYDASALRAKMVKFPLDKKIATRSAGGKVIESLFNEMPNFIGGSADLGPSNKTFVKGFSETGRNRTGRNIHFGVREHAMGSIVNGIAYYGGFVSYCATFLVFLDYMRPPVRIAALSNLHSIFVFTHDSFFVGEDGPTHQPVEHLATARAIPNLHVIRPADAEETAEAWIYAVTRKTGPTMLALTRQDLPVLQKIDGKGAESLFKGAYIIRDCEGKPDIIILSSGSEVHISISASEELNKKGIKVRVVSFPCWGIFDKQSEKYKEEILPDGARFAVVEAGSRFGWEKYAGRKALYMTLDHFGASAPDKVLAEKFGFTPSAIAEKIEKYLK